MVSQFGYWKLFNLYLRGGDFIARQAAGEHPKQLNYSRAFGGKDLKKYGLVVEPDVFHFTATDSDKYINIICLQLLVIYFLSSLLILGSDGLWDALDPTQACIIALQVSTYIFLNLKILTCFRPGRRINLLQMR